jgi:hypothetical protein
MVLAGEGEELASWAKWAKQAKVVQAFCRVFESDTKELWIENGEKNNNLDYEFWAVDLEFRDGIS